MTPVDQLTSLLAGQRSAWLAGTRGEAMTLAPLFKQLCPTKHQPGPGWWLSTSEHGMALHQALDHFDLIPDEVAPQCHPAEEPAQRLKIMLERAEAYGRQRKAQRIVFAGWGPTAVGGALYAHARGGGGVWVRPSDPASLIARLRWESGLERLIRSLAPAVDIIELPVPTWTPNKNEPAIELNLTEEITGLNPTAPRCLCALMRREWGLFDDTFTRYARALARCARAHPQWQFIVLSLLNARLERPLRTLEPMPPNLLIEPPLPYLVYRELLNGARAVLTDSVLVAAEALQEDTALATLGEVEGSARQESVKFHSITMKEVENDFMNDWIAALA